MGALSEPRKRRAWLAALLSLLLPGLGQLYNQQAHLALPLMAASVLLTIPILWFIAAVPVTAAAFVAVVAVTVVIAFTLFTIVQAAITARRAGSIRLAWFNRWYVYVGLYVLAVLWQNIAGLMPISSMRSYSVPAASMIPTVLVGDHFLARTRAFTGRVPERGDLAVLRSPSYPEVDFVKRIIGLPGDRIQLREGRLYINGALVERAASVEPVASVEPAASGDEDLTVSMQYLRSARVYREAPPGGASYLIAETSDNEMLDDTPEYLVPPDHVFVLGDYRDRSNDSRAKLGFIPIALLRDKPLFIFWSADLSRIGKILK